METKYSGGEIDYLVNKAKLEERERIMELLFKNYLAITTWSCWREVLNPSGESPPTPTPTPTPTPPTPSLPVPPPDWIEKGYPRPLPPGHPEWIEKGFPPKGGAKMDKSKELTGREMLVVGFIVEGYTNKLIAKVFHVSTQTIKNSVNKIMRKLGANNRAHVVTLSVRKGYTEIRKC